MRSMRLLFAVAVLTFATTAAFAQTQPNLENGFKLYGSYEGGTLDTVNLMNGNLMANLPAPFQYPQRGSLERRYMLYLTSKNWQVQCVPDTTFGQLCQWQPGIPAQCILSTQSRIAVIHGWVSCAFPVGTELTSSTDLTVKRTAENQITGLGSTFYDAFGYSLVSGDLAEHGLYPIPGTADPTGEATEFRTVDGSGYYVKLSAPDGNGVMNTIVVTDRAGNQYRGRFPDSTATLTGFRDPWDGVPPTDTSGGEYMPLANGAGGGPDSDYVFGQFATFSTVTDRNGNVLNLDTGIDALGRTTPSSVLSTDTSECVSPLPISHVAVYQYAAPDGLSHNLKFCYSGFPIQTNFSQQNVAQAQGPGPSGLHSIANMDLVASIIMPDHTKWTFNYDSYGELIYLGLPLGGSITYTWTEIAFTDICDYTQTLVSRAVASRTVTDNNGNSSVWQYHWPGVVSGSMANFVTDPSGNDTVHKFTLIGACDFHETTTQSFQGSKDGGTLLKQVDTSYYAPAFVGDDNGLAGYTPLIQDVKTTLFPSRRTSLVHREYDSGMGAGKPLFGEVKKETVYDWGTVPGTQGPLLKETDKTYEWESNSAYLTANLLDLTASVSIKDATGCTQAVTEYGFDESGYLVTPTPAISTQHGAPPGALRGNQTTERQWLSTNSCNPAAGTPVVSHAKWLDTGEPYQKIDPLGHTSTITYDPFYQGAYATQTCSTTTAGAAHCVSGTYDFNTGVLTSFTNENASTAASGNWPGDAAHTSNYSYDLMFRMAQAQAPPDPDPANGNARATSTFTYTTAGFPWTASRTRSVTSTASDAVTTSFDGLGRPFSVQHPMPAGPASTVDTTYDNLGRVWKVSNPHFTTSDPTYGITQNVYDVLDRNTSVIEQDGSVKKVDYSAGNCTLSTDEAGNQRRSCTDALGRLTEVDEPGDPTAFVANNYANLATDGNLAVLGPANDIKWQSNTHGATNTFYGLVMQDDGNLIKYTPTWGTAVPSTTGAAAYGPWSCIGDKLYSGQTLASGACMQSPNKRFLLWMQSPGNLVLYDLSYSPGAVLFYSGTTGVSGSRAVMQSDGNLVIYTPSNGAYWSTGTVTGSANYMLQLQDQGNLVIYRDIWDTGTAQTANTGAFSSVGCSNMGDSIMLGQNIAMGSCLSSKSGRFVLNMQNDGNLAVYDRTATPARMLWSTGTQLTPIDPIVAMKTLYFYDVLGNLLCVEQHGNVAPGTAGATGCNDPPSGDSTSLWRVRRFTYDSLSRLLTASNPESNTAHDSSGNLVRVPTTYTYDLDGNLLQKTSLAPNQTGSAMQTISYCYDELHRITRKDYQPHTYAPPACPITTPVVSYTYDSGTNAIGKLTHVADQAGTADYAYDVLGRLTTETRTIAGISKTVSYEYNLDGSIKKLHYPSGAVLTYSPWASGNVAVPWTNQVVDTVNSINYATSANYQADGQMTGFVSGGNITNTFSYNKRLQPINMSASAPGQTVFSIGYDFHVGNGTTGANNGNVFAIYNFRDRTRDQSFTYDSLNRLTSAQNAGTDCTKKTANPLNPNQTQYWGNTYGYDGWGNLKTKSITKCWAENMSLAVGASNQITNAGYVYDSAGNMTTDGTDGVGLHYDPENRVDTATSGGLATTYVYDSDGNRVKKSNNSGGTLYWYMTPGIIGESDLTGTMKSEYVFFNGERVARRDLVAPTGVFYYFSDHLKTASVITDATGAIKADSDYYPWGGEVQFVANDSNHYKFTGKERDTETQLDYFGARYYSNGMGRFITPDNPFLDQLEQEPQSWNMYMYGENNPLRYTDPTGESHVDNSGFTVGDFNGECNSNGHCWNSNSQQWEQPSRDSQGNAPPLFGMAWGHHGFPEWSKLPKGTDAFKWFFKWRTGPLADPKTNAFDRPHREYNEAVKKLVKNFLRKLGKSKPEELTKTEMQQLARKILNSRSEAVKQFFKRLGSEAVTVLENLINDIEVDIVPPIPTVVLPNGACQIEGCEPAKMGPA